MTHTYQLFKASVFHWSQDIRQREKKKEKRKETNTSLV